jgi:integrase
MINTQKASTDLVPVGATEPVTLAERERFYMAAARADRTRQSYGRAWAQFTTWCTARGHDALPASPDTVAAWIVDLADGTGSRKPLSRSTVNQYLSAVVLAHHTAGYPLDRKHPRIAAMWQGISRTKAKTQPRRKAEALMARELRELIEGLDQTKALDARDAALLTLGWAAALRRSELVGLDWAQQGDGAGFVTIAERGTVVTLPTSKGSQTEAVTIVVPCEDMRTACDALERWAAVAGLQPAQPVFRPIDKGGTIAPDRLTDRSISRIVKARIRKLAIAKGKTELEAETIAQAFSGHSMRAGYASTAGAHDEPAYRIQQRMRHKSADTTTGYIRAGEQWTKSGLKGFGF